MQCDPAQLLHRCAAAKVSLPPGPAACRAARWPQWAALAKAPPVAGLWRTVGVCAAPSRRACVTMAASAGSCGGGWPGGLGERKPRALADAPARERLGQSLARRAGDPAGTGMQLLVPTALRVPCRPCYVCCYGLMGLFTSMQRQKHRKDCHLHVAVSVPLPITISSNHPVPFLRTGRQSAACG